jgi:hypothetical protein
MVHHRSLRTPSTLPFFVLAKLRNLGSLSVLLISNAFRRPFEARRKKRNGKEDRRPGENQRDENNFMLINY